MPNRRILLVILISFASLLSLPAAQTGGPVSEIHIDIPYKKFVLTNGLTLIVHEDHKAPIVAVNLWYHVGSKNEKLGKTGFAHLFEHLMFTGSEHLKGTGDQRAFIGTLERLGATDDNGTTNPDRTDFFENVPRNALDVALWLESDRMGYLLGVVDQAKLDTQRGVVQNEKRQDENQPYGQAWELIFKGSAPAGHPYSWTTIGSMEDLNAASLEDVRNWFKTYYGAANAVLVLAGDIEAEAALKKAEHYFGAIPTGPPVARSGTWIPQMTGTHRETLQDRVPQARLYKVWNTPPYGEPDTAYLDLVGAVLTSGKSSRLYKRLVYDDQTATDVSVDFWQGEISGKFVLVATARPGGDLAGIEKAMDEELERIRANGPTPAELQRAQAEKVAGFVRDIERIGGFGGKSDILAMNEIFRGSPDFYQTLLKYFREASAQDLQRAAKRWLADDVYVLGVHPFPHYETMPSTANRSSLPTPDAPVEVKFPAFQRATLSNGLKIILAERHSLPLVDFTLQVDAGFAADQFAIPGAARLSAEMLNEGTIRRTALQISDELASLGANLSAGSDLDSSSVYLSTLTSTLDRALDVYADVILNPSFPEADFQRLRKQTLARIQREKTEPVNMALRVFPRILYGSGHAYGNPLTGSGTEESVGRMTRADLQKSHSTWFKANHATLIIVGDTTLNEIRPKLEELFGGWRPGEVPAKNLASVEHQKKSSVYLIDRPGSLQSIILAGHVAPPRAAPDDIAIETMNTVLGGAFTSRVNVNLREEKHWSYGSGTFLSAARGQRPFIVYAPVQTDKTKEAMFEVDKELRGILGKRPMTEEELVTAQKHQTLRLPGSWETIGAVGNSIGDIVRYSLPDDYFTTYSEKVRALKLSDLNAAANEVVHPDQFVWVIVGDRARIESPIRELGWGEIQRLDADGNLTKH